MIRVLWQIRKYFFVNNIFRLGKIRLLLCKYFVLFCKQMKILNEFCVNRVMVKEISIIFRQDFVDKWRYIIYRLCFKLDCFYLSQYCFLKFGLFVEKLVKV